MNLSPCKRHVIDRATGWQFQVSPKTWGLQQPVWAQVSKRERGGKYPGAFISEYSFGWQHAWGLEPFPVYVAQIIASVLWWIHKHFLSLQDLHAGWWQDPKPLVPGPYPKDAQSCQVTKQENTSSRGWSFCRVVMPRLGPHECRLCTRAEPWENKIVRSEQRQGKALPPHPHLCPGGLLKFK